MQYTFFCSTCQKLEKRSTLWCSYIFFLHCRKKMCLLPADIFSRNRYYLFYSQKKEVAIAMVCKKDVRCDKKIEMLDGKHSAKQAAFLHFFFGVVFVSCCRSVNPPCLDLVWSATFIVMLMDVGYLHRHKMRKRVKRVVATGKKATTFSCCYACYDTWQIRSRHVFNMLCILHQVISHPPAGEFYSHCSCNSYPSSTNGTCCPRWSPSTIQRFCITITT